MSDISDIWQGRFADAVAASTGKIMNNACNSISNLETGEKATFWKRDWQLKTRDETRREKPRSPDIGHCFDENPVFDKEIKFKFKFITIVTICDTIP